MVRSQEPQAPVRLRASMRGAGYGLGPLLVLAATLAVEGGEAQSLAQAVDGIQDDFGISDTMVGLLGGAKVVVGLFGAVLFGILADKWRRTRLLGGAMGIWTGSMAVNAMAPGFGVLFGSRVSVGVVEANGPAGVSLLADYTPVRDRGRAMGVYQGGALLGSIFGLAAGGVLVDQLGWRWSFWMWVPIGAVVTLLVLRLPEPRRGEQDERFDPDGPDRPRTPDTAETPGTPGSASTAGPATADGSASTDDAALLGAAHLEMVEPPLLAPAAAVVGRHPVAFTTAEAYRELLKVPSLWFAILSLTLGAALLNGLQFWGVEFFKRHHDLGGTGAGIVTGLFGLGAAVGVVGGGFGADRLVRAGNVNGRVHVVAFASIGAAVVLIPALAVSSLVIATPMLLVGGMLLTAPLAPCDAIVSDVVIAPLRGRAYALRSIVRSVGALSPLFIGAVSDAVDLRFALITTVPLFAVGGLVMLLATRTYPGDLAGVAARSRQMRDDAGRT